MDEPKFLSLAEVLYLHDESLRRFGGSAGIRETRLIESALGFGAKCFLVWTWRTFLKLQQLR